MSVGPAPIKQLLMLNYDAGEVTEIKPDVDHFVSEKIIIVVDEYNDTVWVWQGALTPLVQRRACLNPANSMKRAGRHYKGETIGFNSNNLEVIYERNLTDPEYQKKLDVLKEAVKNSTPKDGILSIIDFTKKPIMGSTMQSSASQPSPEPTPEPTPVSYIPPSEPEAPPLEPSAVPETPVPEPVEEDIPEEVQTVVEPEVKVEVEPEVEEIVKPVEEKVEPIVESKVGLLLNSILEFFPEIYVAKHRDTMAIEGNEGTLITFKILDREIELSPEYDFNGKKEEVLEYYRNLIKHSK
ncbi:MAG: hypothetical protein ACTSUV_03540 [Candidatus Ranarchaeia archaeon]